MNLDILQSLHAALQRSSTVQSSARARGVAGVESFLRSKLSFFNGFRDGQAAAITGLVSGRSQFLLWPTGHGKSFAMWGTLLFLRGVAVCVVPLNAVLATHEQSARALGIQAVRLQQHGDNWDAQQALKALNHDASWQDGKPLLLIGHPDSIIRAIESPGVRDGLRLAREGGKLALVAIDEARLVVRWGVRFRPAFMQLVKLLDAFRDGSTFAPPTLLLDAAASPPMVETIFRVLALRCDRHTLPHDRGPTDVRVRSVAPRVGVWL